MARHYFHNFFKDGANADKWPVFTVGPKGGTIIRLTHKLEGSSTPSTVGNFEKRDEDDPFTAGDDIQTSDITVNTSSSTITSFNNPDISGRQSVWFVATSVSGTVDSVMFQGEWEDPPDIEVAEAIDVDCGGGGYMVGVLGNTTKQVTPSAGRVDLAMDAGCQLVGVLTTKSMARYTPRKRRALRGRTQLYSDLPPGPVQ